jgi:predicted nucleotidyltransferase
MWSHVDLRCPPYPEAMGSIASTIDAELEAVTAALAAVEPRRKRLVLFGSRARGDARPDSDIDVLVVMPRPR